MSASAIQPEDKEKCLDLLTACHRALDTILDMVATQDAQTVDLPETLAQTERLARRVEALRIRVIALADSARQSVAGGHASTSSWVALTTVTDHRRASLDTALAHSLGNPEITPLLADTSMDDERPNTPTATSSALDQGLLSADHARVIVRCLAELPDWVEPQQRIAFERHLMHQAERSAPAALRRSAHQTLKDLCPPEHGDALDSHESQVLATQEDRALEAARFWMRDNADGAATGQFTVPTLAGQMLRKVLDAMTAPRRRTGSGHASWKQDQLDWQHRRGLAFAELLTHLPTDHLHERTAATVVVTTRLADLTAELQRGGSTDTGLRVSAREVRSAACTAGIIPAVLGTGSVPLDLGHQTRCFTSTQRTALSTIHTECAAQGCDRPFAWTEIHHLNAWSKGGPTNLTNAIP